MFFKVAVLLFLAAITTAFPSDSYKGDPIPYSYAYDVKDAYAGTDFGHAEDSDGSAVKGSYAVQLPDGRKQTVNYVADHYSGYQAQISYFGQAQYPHEYGPAITFKPSGGYH